MITLNFQEVLDRVYNAKKGVEVRYGLGQGFEYCEQYAATATTKAGEAEKSAERAKNAVDGIDQQKADAVKAVQQAQATATDAVTETKNEALQEVSDATADANNAANSAIRSASAAAGSATTASGAATTATTKASEAAASAEASASSASAAAASEANAKKYSEEAGAKANTDKTLSIENAPADAKAVGDIILDHTKDTPEAIFYSKAEVEAKIKEILAAQREEDLARIKFWASDDPTSPASFIGGTWERIKDCTIWGASDTHPVGTTIEAGLPNITGEFVAALRNGFDTYTKSKIIGAFYANGSTDNDDNYNSIGGSPNGIPSGIAPFGFDASRSNSIYGASDTVQPPAYCVYIWRRIA